MTSKTLKHCLLLNPAHKERARTDESFKKALERQDFQDLLKK